MPKKLKPKTPKAGRPKGPKKVHLHTTILPGTDKELKRRASEKSKSAGEVIDDLIKP
jgi:hypothetical protein